MSSCIHIHFQTLSLFSRVNIEVIYCYLKPCSLFQHLQAEEKLQPLLDALASPLKPMLSSLFGGGGGGDPPSDVPAIGLDGDPSPEPPSSSPPARETADEQPSIANV